MCYRSESFFNEFYYPGLLNDIFAGKRPKAPTDISQKDRRQPQLKFTLAAAPANAASTTRNVTVKMVVAEAPDRRAGRAVVSQRLSCEVMARGCAEGTKQCHA